MSPNQHPFKLLVSVALIVCAALVNALTTPIPATPVTDEPFRSAPPLAISGFDLSKGNQRVYQTWFDPVPTVWRGELTAYNVDAKGQVDLGDALWRASERLDVQNLDANLSADPRNCAPNAWKIDGRRIVTRNGNTSIKFRVGSGGLSSSQLSSINADAATAERLVNFVRGDPRNEKQMVQNPGDGSPSSTWPVLNPCSSATGTLRGRPSILGDIVNGKPFYVGAPVSNLTSDGYPAFKAANANRAGRIYVGANDGMLHAFDAATGDEVFAYVPSMLIPGLSALAASPYSHRYYVDGGIGVGDAFVSTDGKAARWRTILVGGLGAGGKGLYALDVTDPNAADEDAARAKILWEISPGSTGYSELGYTYGDPVITRLSDGRAVAIAGNGYSPGGSGKSVLYVIDLSNGNLIRAIAVGAGAAGNPGGLSSPRAYDANSDGRVDFVYAGDVDGKLWKFDLTNKSSASWTSSLLFDAVANDPLATNPLVSIVGTPDVVRHPLGGTMVYFATGSFFSNAAGKDRARQNYAYGIWDGAPALNTAIFDQTLKEAKHGETRVRVTVAKKKNEDQINWNDTSKTRHKGWRTTLPAGEHVMTPGYVREGRYHFTSYAPAKDASTSPALAAKPEESWIMELDFLNGGTSGSPLFDLYVDGSLDNLDCVSSKCDVEGVPVGIYLGVGLYSQPLLALVDSKLTATLLNFNVLPKETTTQIGSGISGGHFDFDVFQGAFVSNTKHVHKYDDVYDVLGVNLTAASDPVMNLLNTSVRGNRVSSSSEFFVLVSNGDLSPAVRVTVGGTEYKAYEFPNKVVPAQRQHFTPTTVKLFQIHMPNNALELKDWGTGVIRAGLHPTAPECVIYYPYRNGPEGEVRNGALTVWVVKKGAPESAIALNVPGKPQKGYKVIDDAWLLKKYTIFWHNGKFGIGTSPCYGDATWTPTPVPVEDESIPTQTPAPGSADPKAGSGAPRGTVPLSTTKEPFQKSATWDGRRDFSGTQLTITTYADGSKLIVTETFDKKGNITKTAQTVPAPVTTTSNWTTVAGGGIKTGQQSRSTGKLGRVGWHELTR